MIIDNIVILLALVLMKGILSAMETAIAYVNASTVRQKAEKGEAPYVLIKKALEHPDRYITTIKTINSIIIIFLGALLPYLFSTDITTHLSAPLSFLTAMQLQTLVIFCLVIVATYFLLLLGNLVPTKIAMKKPDLVLKLFIRWVHVAYYFVIPLVKLLSWSANFFIHILHLSPGLNDDDITEEEIRMMVHVSEESGMIDEDEKEMINNIFEFDNKTVGDIATHRKDIVAIPVDSTIEQVMDVVIFEKFSRIPVYEDNIDNIIGILYIKDFFKYWVTHKDSEFDIKTMLMEPLFVPSSKKTDELFDELKAKKIHFSIVVDEYGGTVGIVTLEDLVEEIMGDIFDEYDAVLNPEFYQIDEGSFMMNGTASLEDVADVLHVALPTDEYDTLSGFLIAQLGRIPSENEHPEIEFDQFLFIIEKAENKRISLVKACKRVTEEPVS